MSIAITASIDPHYRTTKILAVSQGRWGAIAESHLNYDPGSLWNTWLITRFFDGLGTGLETGISETEAVKTAVAEAACHALALDIPAEHGVPYLTFTVLLAGTREWSVYNLGPNLVLHLGRAGTTMVTSPHSELEQLRKEGHIVQDRDRAAANLATVVAARKSEWEDELRCGSVAPDDGDWLLVAPPSVEGYRLALESPPRNRGEVEALIDRLAEPYASYPRTWLAICAE